MTEPDAYMKPTVGERPGPDFSEHKEHRNWRGFQDEIQPLFSEETIEQEIDRQIDSISDEIDEIEENIIKEEEGREARRHVRKWKCKQIESLKELKARFKEKSDGQVKR